MSREHVEPLERQSRFRDGTARSTAQWLVIAAVDVAAVAAILTLPAVEPRTGVLLVAILAGVGFAAGVTKARIPVLQTQIAAAEPFVLFALAAAGPRAAVIVTVAAILGTTVAPSGRPNLRQFTFNLGATTLAVCAGSWWFFALGGGHPTEAATLIVPLAGAMLALFTVNLGLLWAVLLTGRTGLPPRKLWRRWLQGLVPATVSALAVTLAMVAAESQGLAWSLFLGCGTVWLLIMFHHSQANRLSAEGE